MTSSATLSSFETLNCIILKTPINLHFHEKEVHLDKAVPMSQVFLYKQRISDSIWFITTHTESENEINITKYINYGIYKIYQFESHRRSVGYTGVAEQKLRFPVAVHQTKPVAKKTVPITSLGKWVRVMEGRAYHVVDYFNQNTMQLTVNPTVHTGES